MGLYLNSKKPCVIYENLAHSTYFIDKTAMLEELIPLVGQAGGCAAQDARKEGGGNKYICVTRPRRFGKTLNLSMTECSGGVHGCVFFRKGQ